MIPDHAHRVVARQLPHRQRPTLVVHVHEVADELLSALRLEDVEQGMGRPERVPQGEDGVPGRIEVTLMNLKVRSPVPAIHIRRQVWHGQAVVKRSVENGPFLWIGLVNLDAPERLVPCAFRLRLGRLKSSGCGGLCIEVGHGSIEVHEAE